MTQATDKFSLSDLSALADVPQRTVRYYIQQGLVDRPKGEKRGAHYTSRHLEQLLEIRKWQRAGLSLERIRELVGNGQAEGAFPPPPKRSVGDVRVRSFILVAPGVEIAIDPSEADLSPEDIRKLARRAAGLVADLEKEDEHVQKASEGDGDDG